MFWQFARTLPRNFGKIFWGRNLLLHILAIALTYLIVVTGIDWRYFEFFNGTTVYNLFFTAAIAGFVVPLLIVPILWVAGHIKRRKHLVIAGWALAQAGLLGLLVSYVYKALSGRAHPELFQSGTLVDVTRDFHFGLFERGVFWGWPSSHTAVAFAMSVVLFMLYPQDKFLRYAVLLYAFYIGIGVSMSIHWLSDFVAGAILGSVVGVVVARSFKNNVHARDRMV